jgi:hypothetical protein
MGDFWEDIDLTIIFAHEFLSCRAAVFRDGSKAAGELKVFAFGKVRIQGRFPGHVAEMRLEFDTLFFDRLALE